MPTFNRNANLLGIALATAASALWGLSGIAAQVLFDRYRVQPLFLVAVRLWGVAAILLGGLWVRRREALRVARRDLWRLAALGVFGFFMVQLTWFLAIAAVGVAMASFLQFLAPPMTAVYLACQERRLPRLGEGVAVCIALLGTACVVLGSARITFSAVGVVAGILSAAAQAFYTIRSATLVERVGEFATTGYGFLFGAIAATLLAPLWLHGAGHLDWTGVSLIFGVVVFGTLVTFLLFLSALRYVRPTAAGVASTMQLLVASAGAYLLLGSALGLGQYLGGLLILGAVVLLALTGGGQSAPDSSRGVTAAGGGAAGSG